MPYVCKECAKNSIINNRNCNFHKHSRNHVYFTENAFIDIHMHCKHACIQEVLIKKMSLKFRNSNNIHLLQHFEHEYNQVKRDLNLFYYNISMKKKSICLVMLLYENLI